MAERLSLVVCLWLRDDDVSGFEAFERAAAEIAADHDGRIESAVRCSGGKDVPFEVHIVSFPSEAAFRQYRNDSRLAELRPLRERVIARTEIWQGTQQPLYGR